MKKISRRSFLVQTGTVAAIYPMLGLLEGCVPNEEDRENLIKGVNINQENGMNLSIYFINLDFSGNHLTATGPQAYIIVQIPPQSLHEKFFVEKENQKHPLKQQEALLSGHSFLAFQLWPNWKGRKKRKMRYSASDVLAWENQEVFKLLSTFDQLGNFHRYEHPKDVAQSFIRPAGGQAIIDLEHYKKIVQQLLGSSDCYLSILELPAGLLLAPHKRSDNITIEVTQNNYQLSSQEFSFYTKNEGTVKRSIVERGNIEMRFRLSEPGNTSTSIPPALRAIGLVSALDFSSRNATDPCACLQPAGTKDEFLPSFLDESELLFLNQLQNQQERFDINAKGPFLLGSAGASLKFAYKNHQLNGINPSISLVEYEHHFQDGRDNFIKVARIGVIAPTGQKALHVKIAKRKTEGKFSFVNYQEFIEIIETEKPFPEPGQVVNGVAYLSPQAARPIQHYDNQIHFSKIISRFKTTPPIKPVDGCLNHFWVCKQFPDEGEPELMQLEFDYFDKNHKKLSKAARHPIFFMRRDFFCSADLQRLLQNEMAGFDDGKRMRISFDNQIIAFTPDDPTVKEQQPDPGNRINQLATDYSDYYFSIAAPGPAGNIFDTVDYVIYPQISRSKVYIDHLQQYSQEPLPALLEFNSGYLKHFFNEQGNRAKVILEQSEDFINGKIKNFRGAESAELETITALNNGYAKIIQVFNEAGDRIGGMINPGIENKLLAFGAQGLTYPKDINAQWEQPKNKSIEKALKAVDIFSSDAEIVNGVSLVMILSEISDAGGTPGFAADKLLAQIENFQSYVDEFSNPWIKDAILSVKTINDKVRTLKNELDQAQALLNAYSQQLVVFKNELLQLVPDINKVKAGAKLAFERTRLSAFQLVSNPTEALKLTREELVRELYNQRPDFDVFLSHLMANGARYHAELQALANRLSADQVELKARLALITPELFTELKNAVEKIPKALADIQNGSVDVLIGVPYDTYFTTASGVQGILDLEKTYKRLLAEYLEGKDVLDRLNASKKQLGDLQKLVRESLYYKVKTILLCYNDLIRDLNEAEKTAADQFFNVLRILEKASVSYYVDRCKELERDFADLQATAATVLKDVFNDAAKLASDAAGFRKDAMSTYISLVTASKPDLQALNDAWKEISDIETNLTKTIEQNILDATSALNAFGAAQKAKALKELKGVFDLQVGRVQNTIKAYETLLVNHAKSIADQLEQEIQRRISSMTDLRQIRELKNEFDRVKRILTTPKKEEFKYQWETSNFKTASMGIIKFNPESNPATKLKADVRTTIHIDPLKFPNVVDRIDTYAENSLTNFSLTFLSALTVSFGHVKFITGSTVKTKMNVSIRDVKFDGALSFVQKLEELMGGLGDGFSIAIRPSNVGIGYTSPVFSISTPGFLFSNISISVMLQIFFDRKPMELTFMLAKPEAKATIAAGIYGGGFYCALTAQPKRGLKSIEMALEMGAILGIRLGPIKGEVRFMIGLFYKKDDTGVILEGYFVAEGILSVWIIRVSARLYMYVRSQNSSVTGGCKATYSARLALVKRSYTGSYSKKLAGAESKRGSSDQSQLFALASKLGAVANGPDDPFEFNFQEDEYQGMTAAQWEKFYHTFYRS